MRVCVFVKMAPARGLRLHIDPNEGRLDRSGAHEVHANDVAAVEVALRLTSTEPGEVVIVTMAPEGAVASLRPVLALGADRALVISDERLVGSDLLVTGRVLAAAHRLLEPSIALFGAQSSDGGGAMLASAVAERLGLPLISAVEDVRPSGRFVTGWRRTARSALQLRASLPCVVGLASAAEPARTPSFREAMGARGKPVEVISAASLGLIAEHLGHAGSRSRVKAVRPAAPRPRSGEVILDDGRAARWLLEALERRGLV